MTGIGDSSHVILCETLSGSGISVTYDSTDEYQFIKAPTPKIDIAFNSKVKHRAYHESRMTPDVKFTQSYTVQNGKLISSDANATTEWIVEKYIAKEKIYLLVDMPPPAGDVFVKKSWYNNLNAKVYYLKGFPNKLSIQQAKGRVWKISFNFGEIWSD